VTKTIGNNHKDRGIEQKTIAQIANKIRLHTKFMWNFVKPCCFGVGQEQRKDPNYDQRSFRKTLLCFRYVLPATIASSQDYYNHASAVQDPNQKHTKIFDMDVHVKCDV